MVQMEMEWISFEGPIVDFDNLSEIDSTPNGYRFCIKVMIITFFTWNCQVTQHVHSTDIFKKIFGETVYGGADLVTPSGISSWSVE